MTLLYQLNKSDAPTDLDVLKPTFVTIIECMNIQPKTIRA
jgi:hypothetical protein